MMRKLFTLASAVSLVLCVGVVVLWIRSYWVADGVVLKNGDDRTCEISISTRGRVELTFARPRQSGDRIRWDHLLTHEFDSPYDMVPLPHRFLGVGWGEASDLPPWFSRPAIAMPHGYLVGLLLIPPLMWLHRTLRIQRLVKRGLCARCGYDLRATPDRCPECGNAVTPEATLRRYQVHASEVAG